MDSNNTTDVIVIGAGLTGLTLACFLKNEGKKVLLIEKESQVGGVIKTHKEAGFIFESGPNTGVLSSPELVELFELLGDKCTLETANPDSKKRWIWKKGEWRPLPSGLKTAINTPLFRFRDKLRILGEPFRKKGINPNESIADMVKRRMGKSFLDYAIDPFISGVYAGDPEKLITKYALPKLYALEQEYGSFIGGAMKKRKLPKTDLEKKATKEVFSVKGGLYNLISALEKQVGSENIITGVENVKVNPDTKGFSIEFEDENSSKQKYNAEKVVSTIGGYAIPGVFNFLSEEEKEVFNNMEYAQIVQAVACYNNWKGKELKAFGGLIPSTENRNSLGILFPSSIFAGRAPEGGAILSIFMGGRKKPEMFMKSEPELQEIVFNEIKETMKLDNAKPDLLKLFRYKHAIPQYEITSGKRFETIKSIEAKYPGLILAGNIRDGIGMADRVKQAVNLARSI